MYYLYRRYIIAYEGIQESPFNKGAVSDSWLGVLLRSIKNPPSGLRPATSLVKGGFLQVLRRFSKFKSEQ